MRLGHVAAAVGLAIVFALALLGSAILHLGLPAPRRLVEARVNGALAAAFAGRITVQTLDVLRVDRFGGVDVEVLDPEGVRVLELHHVRARLDVLALIRSLVRGGGVVVRLPELGIDRAEAVLEEDAAGELGLRRAFAPRRPSRRAQGTPPGGHDVELSLPDLRLGSGWVHGQVARLPPLDVHLGELEGAFTSRPGLTAAEVAGEVDRIPVRAAASLRGDEGVASLRAWLGAGELLASGTATLPAAPRGALVASAKIEAKALDLHLLRGEAPPSSLTGVLQGSVIVPASGELSGTFDLESQAGRVGEERVPAARARGELTRRSLRGVAEIAEPGAPTIVQFSLGPRGSSAGMDQLALQVDTDVPDLAALRRVGPLGRGRAHLVAEGELDLETRQIAASASVAVSALELRGVHLSRAVVTGRADGPLASPHVVARLLGTGLRAGGHRFTRVRAGVVGSAREADVEAELCADEHAALVAARAHLSAAAATVHLDGELRAHLGDAGRVELTATQVVVRGSPTELSSWRTATGTVALRGSADLARVLALLPEEARPVASAAGTITLRGKASRASPAAEPSVALEGCTEGLAVVARPPVRPAADGAVSPGARPWRTAGIDGSFVVRTGGSGGRTSLAVTLHDRLGPLASLEAAASLPFAALAADPHRLLAQVREVPLEARLAVPRRSLGALPPALGELPVAGEVELAVDLRGTARAPHLVLTAKGTNLRPKTASPTARRAEVTATAAYDGHQADVRVVVHGDGRDLGSAGVIVTASAAQALAGEAIAWEASGEVAVTAFPLDAAGALWGLPLAGSLSGAVAFRDLHGAASLKADLDVRHLTLAHTTFPRGQAHVTVAEGALAGTARLEQIDGYAETSVTGVVGWGAALAPSFETSRPIDLTIRARNLRADAAMPFVRGTFSELDGRLDADALVHVDEGGKDGQMTGAVVLRDGVFEVPQYGERFHAARGRLLMKPWGTLRVEDFSAAASRGSFTASAEAVLDGLALRHVDARIHVAPGESLPVTLADVPMGQAYGDVSARAQLSPDGKRLDLVVTVPTLQVELPRSTGHPVQSLDADPTIRTGVHRGGSFVALPLGPPRRVRAPSERVIHAAILLGSDVGVRRETSLQVALQGRLFVDVGAETRVSGRLDLERGRLDLQGKRFTLDHGTVSFVGGDPENPMVVATAYWDGPDGTRVFADFSGYVRSGTLELRSEPSLSQDEILALLLFGAPEGAPGTEGPSRPLESTGIRVAGMAGNLVAQALNAAISGITGDVKLRVDTSRAASPRPELVVELSRRVTARLAYSLGVPGPGEDPDRAALTLDWRFDRDWSLVAVVGDQGSTALDVVWRLRY